MGIILLIKKKYRKQHAAVGDKTEEGEQKKKRIDGAGKQRVSVMTQFNLAAQHTFGFEVVWTADMWSLGIFIVWLIYSGWVPRDWELCSRYLWNLLFIWLRAFWCSDHPSNTNAHLHMLSCAPLCVFKKRGAWWFFKIQMDGNVSISSALCAWAGVSVGGNCFPELFAGVKGNLTLLMANADAEISSSLCYEHQSLESHCEASFA